MPQVIRNWSDYNAGLKQRGSLTFWINEDVLNSWVETKLSGKRGESRYYSDVAIATMSTVKSIYGLGGRQCQGFLASILSLMGLDLAVPDHSTLSRRLGQLRVCLPVVNRATARHVVIDSTGVKVYGEGEWKARQHGVSKRRTWRKLNVGVDEQSGEILVGLVSTNDVHDGTVMEELLEGIAEPIEQVSADGAYDHGHCYDAIAQREARAVIPPRKDAVIWQHGNCKAPPHPRDENLRYIRKHGRKKWKRDHHYHRRSLAETTMFRFKTIFGGKVRSRTFENQATELLLQCAALNRMIQVAKPDSLMLPA